MASRVGVSLLCGVRVLSSRVSPARRRADTVGSARRALALAAAARPWLRASARRSSARCEPRIVSPTRPHTAALPVRASLSRGRRVETESFTALNPSVTALNTCQSRR